MCKVSSNTGRIPYENATNDEVIMGKPNIWRVYERKAAKFSRNILLVAYNKNYLNNIFSIKILSDFISLVVFMNKF
jgi:hypothetical protein